MVPPTQHQLFPICPSPPPSVLATSMHSVFPTLLLLPQPFDCCYVIAFIYVAFIILETSRDPIFPASPNTSSPNQGTELTPHVTTLSTLMPKVSLPFPLGRYCSHFSFSYSPLSAIDIATGESSLTQQGLRMTRIEITTRTSSPLLHWSTSLQLHFITHFSTFCKLSTI